jgi:hypothetical protein
MNCVDSRLRPPRRSRLVPLRHRLLELLLLEQHQKRPQMLLQLTCYDFGESDAEYQSGLEYLLLGRQGA